MKYLFASICQVLIVNLIFGQSLNLTANECFFSPTGTLKAYETASTGGEDYNKGRVFSHILNCSEKNDTILWYVDFVKTGALTITPHMGVPNIQDGSKIEVFLNNKSKIVELSETGGLDNYQAQEPANFNISSPGRYAIKLCIGDKNQGSIGNVKKMVLSGAAVKNASFFMRRWRPAAIHSKLYASKAKGEIEISVHVNTVVKKDMNVYQPITTPFGYIGSSWDPDKQTFGGYNFSLWNIDIDGTGASTTCDCPLKKKSHLLAVGPGLEQGEFSHEGCGVKPRGSTAWGNGWITDKQVIALRMEPGDLWSTYYTYYLGEDGHWKIWGAAKKHHNSGLISQTNVGTFVEVTGQPSSQRSGHYQRECFRSGWQINAKKEVFPIDRMTHKGNNSDISYKEWGVAQGGSQFTMKMGGMLESSIVGATLSLNNPAPTPEYLKGDLLDELYQLPTTIETFKPTSIKFNSVEIPVEIIGIGKNPEVTTFYGTKDGLTFDYEWENSIEIKMDEGRNTLKIVGLANNKKYFYRIRIKNDDGIYWMYETKSFITDIISSVSFKTEEENIYLFPNPSSDGQFRISNKSGSDISITVHDFTGQKVFESLFSRINDIVDLSSLTNGMYFVSMVKDYNVTNQKIIIRSNY